MTTTPRNPDIAYPALRYFGGKWVLAPWIIGHMHEMTDEQHVRLLET
ncbi:MAG: hypothetical protein LBT71_00340 [Azoarcus sp.]|jgi:site-specific DNA-adenine methylase|nr:hypothetical protein [Azoarcus sp.]